MNTLAAIRKKKLGITQAELAAICEVAQSTVSRWESGADEPSRPHLGKIRRYALESSIEFTGDEFFTDWPPRKPKRGGGR